MGLLDRWSKKNQTERLEKKSVSNSVKGKKKADVSEVQ